MMFETIERKNKYEKELLAYIKKIKSFFLIKDKTIPLIFAVPDRKTYDKLRGMKTENWMVGFVRNGSVFVFDENAISKVSKMKYSKERYLSLIEHELTHIYYMSLVKSSKPRWLNEGLAIYFSNQPQHRNKVKEFSSFLSYYDFVGEGLYSETGQFIGFLIKKYGTSKLLRLINSLKTINLDSENQFSKLFEKIYGFKLNYSEINRRYSQ